MSTTPDRLDHLADLTRRYSAWGRGGREGGLPLAWGGLTLMLLVCGWTLMGVAADSVLARVGIPPASSQPGDLQAWHRTYAFLDKIRPVVLVLLPLAWILGKDAFRARLYQAHGRVEPALPGHASGVQLASRITLILAGAGFPIAMAWISGGEPLGARQAPVNQILALTAAWALPWLGWNRVRGTLEALLWTTMGLLTLLWLWLPLTETWLGPVVFIPSFFVGPVVFATGLMQHLRFRRLGQELRALEAP
ncbi:MAG TPA: hypothetical protein VJ505_16480 [Holophagaceae bacterium]|nr:hypothetical protein [Holophagaceae bacterium]